MKKRILILANNDVGLFKFRKELIQELLDPGSFTGKINNDAYEVYISLPKGELVQPLIDMGCEFIDTPVDRRGIDPITDFRLIMFYKRLFKEVKPDKVITYTIKPNIYGSYVAKKMKIPYYVNITGLGTAFQNDNWLKKLVVFLYKKSLSNVKKVFFENIENKERFIDNSIICKDRTVLLNGAGVNIDEYRLTSYPNECDALRFLFIGRIMKEKGIDELLWSAKEIKKEYPNVQFDIVGEMEDNYKEIIDKYVNDGFINYYGYQSDVKPFIAKCNCFVLPSYHEGMANTLLEAAAMGRPLITSDIHGCKEAVLNNGYCIPVGDKNLLLESIKDFIEKTYLEKKEYAENSYIHIKNIFDKKNIVLETVSNLKGEE